MSLFPFLLLDARMASILSDIVLVCACEHFLCLSYAWCSVRGTSVRATEALEKPLRSTRDDDEHDFAPYVDARTDTAELFYLDNALPATATRMYVLIP